MDDAELIEKLNAVESSGKPFNELRVPEGMVWQYKVVLRGGYLEHLWALTGKHGAVHISARLHEWDGRPEWSGGIECHFAAAPDYREGEEPNHEHCWLLGKPCWHDGSSLYFSENIAQKLPPAYEPWSAGDMSRAHGYLLYDLINWYRNQIEARLNATDTKEECE